MIAFWNDGGGGVALPAGAVDAEPVPAEVVAQQLGREQRGVREPVGLGGERGVAAHRERERLVLLDQVEEAGVGAELARGRGGDVGGPPRRGHEAIAARHLQARRLAAEGDLDPVEQPVEPAVALDVRGPVPRQRADRVDGDDPHAQALLREPPREVELGDVAAEEVAQVERRDEHVHASRGVVAHGEAQRRDLLGQRAQRRVADRARARPRVQRRRRDGVQAPAALRFVARREGERAAPRERVEQHPLRPERLGTPPRQIARAARARAGRSPPASARRA